LIGVIYDEEAKRIIAILKGFVCSWNKCTFCCFYEEAAKNLNDLILTAKEIITRIKGLMNEKLVDRISFFNGGSFFELPLSVIHELSKITSKKIIEIESRPEFLSKDSINYLYSLLKPSKLVIRIGFESIHDEIRNNLLNKGIKDSEVKRILELRNKIKNEFGDLIEFIAYVLFGIEGIDEKSVVTSVREFNKSLDGVIAIKYKSYHEWMPKEVKVSKELLEFLRMNCLDVDLTESGVWKINYRH
jgi:radical SAM enzyme (TIGR01210 family)